MHKFRTVTRRAMRVQYRLTTLCGGQSTNTYATRIRPLRASVANLPDGAWWAVYKTGPLGIPEHEVAHGHIDRDSDAVFISGPVSGIAHALASQRFAAAAYHLRHFLHFHHIVNPVNVCDPSWSWTRCMAACLPRLLRCSHVYFLIGWNNSRGARLEHRIARLTRKTIIYQHLSQK